MAGRARRFGSPAWISRTPSSGWQSPDFIKIDAEGEEERILSGAQEFFSRHSPLVMFEIKAGATINEKLLTAFPAMGYRLFKLIAGAPILVPIEPRVPLDRYELNLFAAKPDRIQSIGDAGFLLDKTPDLATRHCGNRPWTVGSARATVCGHVRPSARRRRHNRSRLFQRIGRNSQRGARTDPAQARCGALYFAYRTLAALCNRAPIHRALLDVRPCSVGRRLERRMRGRARTNSGVHPACSISAGRTVLAARCTFRQNFRGKRPSPLVCDGGGRAVGARPQLLDVFRRRVAVAGVALRAAGCLA